MSDQQTPQTSRPNKPPQPSGFDFNQPTIVSLLYLASFAVGFTGLIGVVLAHVWKGEASEPWEASHFQYLIRTFWISLVGFIVSFLLMIVVIGIPMMIAVAVWVGIRSVMSLVKAQKREPMPDPETLLI